MYWLSDSRRAKTLKSKLMLISFGLGCTIAAIFGIGILALIVRFYMKRQKKVQNGVLVGILLGIFVAAGIIMMNSRAYIISADGVVSYYMLYGSKSYELSNGQTVTLEAPLQKCVMVNDTPDDYIVEAVIYGFTSNIPDDEVVAAYSAEQVNIMSVNYLPNDTPPMTIESEASGAEIHYWLRTLSSYTLEYGDILNGDLEDLQELLEEDLESDEEEALSDPAYGDDDEKVEG